MSPPRLRAAAYQWRDGKLLTLPWERNPPPHLRVLLPRLGDEPTEVVRTALLEGREYRTGELARVLVYALPREHDFLKAMLALFEQD